MDSSRRQDSEYLIYISIDTCRQKVMILEASWARVIFGVDTPEGPPTPKTPLPVLPPRQKGYQPAPFSDQHQSAYSSTSETEVCKVMGQN